MKLRIAFPVSLAIVALVLGSQPAVASQASAHSQFRPVLVGRSGTVNVKTLPSRARGAGDGRTLPFLAVGAAAARGVGSGPSTVSTVSAPATGSSLEALTSFQGVTLDQQLALGADQFVTPPDNATAAGPNHVVEMVNDSGTIWDKSGHVIAMFDLNTFFAVPSGYTFSDPRILYDQASGRWFASGVAFVAPSYGSGVTIAVSTTSDPTGTWVQYLADNSANLTHDQPKIGVSSDKVVLSWNDFQNAQFFLGQSTWVFEKSQMVAGASSVNGAALGPDSSRVAPVPAVQLSAGSAEYIVYNNSDCLSLGCNQFSPTLGLAWITGTPLQGNVTWNESDPGMPATSQPPNADQPGMPGSLATNDDRFLTAVWQNGVLWTGGNDACQPANDSSTRPCSRLIQVSTSGPTITQDFDIASTGGGLFYPAVGMDAGNNLFVVYNISSASQYVGVRIIGELFSAPPQTLVGAQTIRPGDATYDMNPCFRTSGVSRWGDYAAAAIDPQNPTDVWVAGEYAAIGSAADAGCAWATFAGRLTFSAPSVTGISPTSEQSSGSTVVTVTGADFTTASSVQFGANAASNVTVSSPNRLTATAPAGCGTVDVTVTTADGTSAASSADQFTYLTPCGGSVPTLTSISPTSGSAGGNTSVTVNGTGFVQGQTVVFFGPNSAPAVSCSSSTQCVATSPAGLGNVTVTATVGGQAATGSATFSYVPSLSSISPSTGSPRGGTTVTIVGVGFDAGPGATLFYFGADLATSVTCSSSTQCTAVTPAGQRNSTVSVKAVVDGITSSNTLSYRYLRK